MKRSISNIAWQEHQDQAVYERMMEYGYDGLEIAPARIYPKDPYDRTKEIKIWAQELNNRYGFAISSMQSIWYGRQEQLFGSLSERQILLDYTKKAVDFAKACGCKNLVFGCPKNRVLPKGKDSGLAVSFFKEIGDYAAALGTVIGMEANPSLYHTNYMNYTMEVLDLIEQTGSAGFLLNLDVGTMLYNKESVDALKGRIHCISHVHISEPGLKLIQPQKIHRELYEILSKEQYQGYISIEMGKTNGMDELERTLKYVKEVFK